MSTSPKITQKTTKEVTKKVDAKATNIGFNAQTYEESFKFRKYQQGRKWCYWEKSDQQIPAVEEECKPYQVESTFTLMRLNLVMTYDESKYLTQVDDSLQNKATLL